MTRTAEINPRLLEDLPVVRLPKFVPPGGGLSIWWMGDDKITFQAISSDTNGAYAFWVDEPPGNVGPPKHVHSCEEEGFYIIDGQVEFHAGLVDAVLTKDSFIALPKGIPHSWINSSTGQARLITFTAGAGNEGFFLTLGAPGVGPAGPRATLPLEEINARTRRYGVTYMKTTDNPLDGALEIGAGRSATVVGPTEGERPGETYEATAGSFLIIPWGLPHEIRNTERSAARLLLLSVPGGVEDYYRAACRPSNHGRWQDDLETDLARLRTVGPRFGVFE